jgi:hypothetical protein
MVLIEVITLNALRPRLPRISPQNANKNFVKVKWISCKSENENDPQK